MRIEITIEGQEPVIYQLMKEKTVVGSGSDCDIQVDAEGVSRKHTVIFAKDDTYAVVDQGSTNGTFINEDRLVPGQRAEFTSFFPVKIGHLVTMSLLPDEEGAPKFELAKDIEVKKSETTEPRVNAASSAPKTLSSSLNESFKSSGTRSGASAGTKTGLRTARPAPGKPGTSKPGVKGKAAPLDPSDKARMRNSMIIAVVVLLGGFAYFFFKQSEDAEVEKVAEAQAQAVAPVVAPKLTIPDLRIKDRLPSDVLGILNYLSYPKCGQDLEKSICANLKLPLEGFPGTGLRREGETVQLVLPHLSPEEIFDAIGVGFGWYESYRQQMAQYADPRHMIDFYFSHVDAAKWAALVDGTAWVEVAFVNREGLHQGDIWFVATKTLAQHFQSPALATQLAAVRKGQIVVDHASGYFRRVSPPAATPAAPEAPVETPEETRPAEAAPDAAPL